MTSRWPWGLSGHIPAHPFDGFFVMAANTDTVAPQEEAKDGKAPASGPALSQSSLASEPHHHRLPSVNYHPMALFDTVWSYRPSLQHHESHPSGATGTGPTPHHHFHFPPATINEFAEKAKSYVHRRKPHGATGVTHSAWSPDTDIRETEQGYRIDIEVPGVADKSALLIQWMSPRTLVVEGQSGTPTGAKGDLLWEQDHEGWATEARHPQTTVSVPLRVIDL